MDNYRLSITIDKNPKALGLSTRERELIERAHQATGATLAVCFLELIAEQWDITGAIINIGYNQQIETLSNALENKQFTATTFTN